MREAVSAEFEIVFSPAGRWPLDSPLHAGEYKSECWTLGYAVDCDDSPCIALFFPSRKQAEIALKICKHLGITPEIYEAAANSPAGSGELRRRIMELFPW